MKGKRVYLLDAGHGGVNPQGVYTTDPSFDPNKPGVYTKGYVHEDGTFIREGEFNRNVLKELIQLINKDRKMLWKIITPGFKDITLRHRVEYANHMQKIHGNCVYVSIHGNAGGGNGFEVYTSVGETESDKIADEWIKQMKKEFPKRVDRGEKDRNFYVIRHTICPAILTESFFMDTLKDCKLMNSEAGVKKVAMAHYKMMKAVDNWK